MNLGAAFVLVALAFPPGPRDVTVDCDAGGSLARALARASRHPGITIHVKGTCTGSFVVRAEGISIEGDSRRPAVIQGRDDAIANRRAVLDIVADRFSMRDITVRRGWIGVHVHGGTRSQVELFDSAFEDNYGGVLVDAGSFASIRESTFRSNEIGVAVQFGSRASIVGCEIRDSGQHGVDVFDHSTVGLSRSTVSGSGAAGAIASIDSFLGIGETTLSENGGSHVVAQDRSRLQIYQNATFGSDGDGTQLAAYLDIRSILGSSSPAEFWGDVFAAEGCHVSLGRTALHGSLLLHSFTDASLSRTTVDGVVECHRGADAFCDEGVTASVSGCASAGPPCTGVPPAEGNSLGERPRPPVVDERLVNSRNALHEKEPGAIRDSE